MRAAPLMLLLCLPACSGNAVPGKTFGADEASRCFRDQGLTVQLFELDPPELDVVEVHRRGVTVTDVLFAASPDEAEEFAQSDSSDVEIRGNALVQWYGSETERERDGIKNCLS